MIRLAIASTPRPLRFWPVGADIITAGNRVMCFETAAETIALWTRVAEAELQAGHVAAARAVAGPANDLAKAYLAASEFRRAAGCLSDLTQRKA